MTRKLDDLEKIRMLVKDVGAAPDSVNEQDLKRDLDSFAESLRSDDLYSRDRQIQAKIQKKEFDQLARYADGLLASFETESLRSRNIPDDFRIVDKDKLIAQLRLLAHWARNEAVSAAGSARRISDFLNCSHSKIFSLALIYERHFQRRAGASEIAGKAGGPFIRFALYALNEHDAASGRPKIAAGTLKRALSQSRRHYRFDVATGTITIRGNPLHPRRRHESR
ncbi:hypothetical protein [Methylocystis hirsuta]|uniref:Uncharacterized protein n=1 Tax=Methylocystis hirsuta TaxID=369798 RepID=A0A3M9XQJ1_9HYPH|nr:hypothetical protein [Methylocystis hirsuta]RNJ50294.1 hypothetical protein D1O30_12485 [Methylocystis hirsuta]